MVDRCWVAVAVGAVGVAGCALIVKDTAADGQPFSVTITS